ncbi:hypothetical protein Pmani_031709 [Petrolisthes manimaculis]|uniref:MADF domain-containing protein n=2 Tax=Petrolisthes manimaculis TaxID=1843537 RepID=A0AAE1NV40_9EUCA|nr:hypothetical protein Pmani_031709 [Petrolisthes manimaculis]
MDNISSLRWSRESELFVIEKVRQNECLWDHRDPMFLKKTFKRHLYHRIAIAIQEEFPALAGVTADAVMHKWDNLKKSFSRELQKAKNPKSGSGYTSKWHLFELLMFLTDTASADKSVCNYNEHQSKDNSPASMAESQDVVDGTSLVYSGSEDVDGMLTHFLHDGSEDFSPASSSSPRSSSSRTQQAGSSRVMPGCSTNTGGVNLSRPPLCSPAPKRSRTTPKPGTPKASNKAWEILQSTCVKSNEKNRIAFGLYQMIEQHFQKISEKNPNATINTSHKFINAIRG